MASPSLSPSLTRTTSTTSATDSTGNLTPTTSWTSEQESRLTYCQDQLKQAQKKWSDRQELWIREVITTTNAQKKRQTTAVPPPLTAQVEHLLELKRAHKKAQKKKKQKTHAEKALLRKTKTWRPLSRTQSSIMDTTTASAPGTGLLDDGDGDEEVSLRRVERSDSLPQQKSSMSSCPSSPSSPTQSTGRNPFMKMIRRMSSASIPGRGRGAEAEGSGSRNEV